MILWPEKVGIFPVQFFCLFFCWKSSFPRLYHALAVLSEFGCCCYPVVVFPSFFLCWDGLVALDLGAAWLQRSLPFTRFWLLSSITLALDMAIAGRRGCICCKFVEMTNSCFILLWRGGVVLPTSPALLYCSVYHYEMEIAIWQFFGSIYTMCLKHMHN